jgi:6-pyruvoyltetrahydropterin/6-carboxytetrahydropterin synthase
MAHITCSRRLEWDALHRVPAHPGQCRAFHGHRYIAIITCTGEVRDDGMIIDFGIIKSLVGSWIDRNWDHTGILCDSDDDPAAVAIVSSNQAFGRPVYLMSRPPTAENIALELATVATTLLRDCGIDVVRIDIAETPNCSASWVAGA